MWLHPTDPADRDEPAAEDDDDDEEEDAAPEGAAAKAEISTDGAKATTPRAPGAPSTPRASPGLMAGERNVQSHHTCDCRQYPTWEEIK